MRAWELAPDNHEHRFWAGLGIAHGGAPVTPPHGGMLEAGVEQVREAIAAHPPWRELLERLSPEVAPSAPAVREALEAGER